MKFQCAMCSIWAYAKARKINKTVRDYATANQVTLNAKCSSICGCCYMQCYRAPKKCQRVSRVSTQINHSKCAFIQNHEFNCFHMCHEIILHFSRSAVSDFCTFGWFFFRIFDCCRIVMFEPCSRSVRNCCSRQFW